MNVRCGEYPYLLRYIHGGAIHRTLFCYSGSPAPLCKNRVSMDGSTFFNYVWHFDGSRSADKNTITMTNKLKVFAMLLCVALFGIFSSCGKDDGGYSIPSNDNEIYNLLIGKWNVEIISDEDENWCCSIIKNNMRVKKSIQSTFKNSSWEIFSCGISPLTIPILL